MKALGKRKQDDECCPGHAKYPTSGKPHGHRSKQEKTANKSRKAKIRQQKIDLEKY